MIKSLHIDIEGGWGGSSRSLYELINILDRKQIQPTIIHRQNGPISERYKKLNVKTYFIPGIYSFAPRPKNSWKIFIGSLFTLKYFPTSYFKILKVIKNERIEIIHLNYEGLFFLGLCLRITTKLPIIGHVRTLIPNNFFGKILTRIYFKICKKIFCITENEQANFLQNLPKSLRNDTKIGILFNVFNPDLRDTKKEMTNQILYLGNIHPDKGIYKIIELAEEIKKRNIPIEIKVCGKDRTGGNFDEIFRNVIYEKKLEHIINFIGHTSNPELELQKSMFLIRLSSDFAPWGRDVIEAIRLGTPVIALGEYEGVIQNNVSGFLYDSFDPELIVNKIQEIQNNRFLWASLSNSALKYGNEFFSGKIQKNLLENALTSRN